MSYRRRAGGGKRDIAEGPIVAAGRAVGAEVWHVGGLGLPDLLVRYKGVWTVWEVKTGKGSMTAAQVDESGAAVFPVVRTVDEFLRGIGAIR